MKKLLLFVTAFIFAFTTDFTAQRKKKKEKGEEKKVTKPIPKKGYANLVTPSTKTDNGLFKIHKNNLVNNTNFAFHQINYIPSFIHI